MGLWKKLDQLPILDVTPRGKLHWWHPQHLSAPSAPFGTFSTFRHLPAPSSTFSYWNSAQSYKIDRQQLIKFFDDRDKASSSTQKMRLILNSEKMGHGNVKCLSVYPHAFHWWQEADFLVLTFFNKTWLKIFGGHESEAIDVCRSFKLSFWVKGSWFYGLGIFL